MASPEFRTVPVCPKHKIKMLRRKNQYGYFWQCLEWPFCDFKAQEFDLKMETIYSTPADKETRELRVRAHKLCDIIFKDNKTAMYRYIKTLCAHEHIGQMPKGEIKMFINRTIKNYKAGKIQI